MKNNIEQKIIKRFSEITISENPSSDVFERIRNNINESGNVKSDKKINKIVIKPILVAIMFAFIITTAAAATPLILKMLGSDISFFNSDKQTRYSADQELIKKFSSEVGVTAKKDGFTFTVDNVAFDGTFMSVFYTIKSSEINLYEEVKENIKKYNKSNYGENLIVQDAIARNYTSLEIPGHELLHNTYIYSTSDGYFVTDYELKAVQRYIITDDLPDVFDINVIYHQYNGRVDLWPPVNDEGTYDMPVPITIGLTIDTSESEVEKLVINPNLPAKVIQSRVFNYNEYTDERAKRVMAGDVDENEDISGVGFEYTEIEYPNEVEHDIVIDRVSLSPLGNILVITEKGSENPVNKELFSHYFIVDDKGNSYGKISSHVDSRSNPEEDNVRLVEFYGDVPSDAQYLKLIPYNQRANLENSVVEFKNLPLKLVESEYGGIIIESCFLTNEKVILNYRYEGMVSFWIRPFLTAMDSEKPLADERGYTSAVPIYNSQTNSFTHVYTFVNPLENAKDIVKGVEIPRLDLELLEDQAVIIPLQ